MHIAGGSFRENVMNANRIVSAGVLAFLCACGQSSVGKEVATAQGKAASKAPQPLAVTKQFNVEMDKLIAEESTYVDGFALRLKDGGAGAVLTEAPLSACARLAISARGNLEFNATTYGDKPTLLLIRNDEHPNGAILKLEPYVTTTLEDALPALVTDGDNLMAKGDVGDAGWGSIDPTKYGSEKAPHVRLNVKLPYASLAKVDALAADASAEAAWLRDLQKKAAADTQAVVDGSIQVNEEDSSSYSTTSSWFEILGNWGDVNVVALATDTNCATMVLRTPGFAGGYREAIVETRLIDNVRKVIAAQTESMDSVEGSYVIGRIEHAALGAFPLLHARAAREEGVGLVVYFSDKPFGAEPFETLVARQRMLRAVSGMEYSGQYSFSHYDLGGPGVPVEQVDAGNSTTNPSVDEKEIAGLIKLGDAGVESPHIAVNYRLPLGQ